LANRKISASGQLRATRGGRGARRGEASPRQSARIMGVEGNTGRKEGRKVGREEETLLVAFPLAGLPAGGWGRREARARPLEGTRRKGSVAGGAGGRPSAMSAVISVPRRE
jgi:hypothetical protein